MAFWENLKWEKLFLEKPIAYLRKTYLEKPTILFGKKKLLGKPIWEKPFILRRCVLILVFHAEAVASLSSFGIFAKSCRNPYMALFLFWFVTCTSLFCNTSLLLGWRRVFAMVLDFHINFLVISLVGGAFNPVVSLWFITSLQPAVHVAREIRMNWQKTCDDPIPAGAKNFLGVGTTHPIQFYFLVSWSTRRRS